MTGIKQAEYTRTQLRNIPSLRKLAPEPIMEINLITARKNNVINGETNIIETKKRSIKIKVKITETIIPNVVAIPHG
ncbi:MAG: molybdopterin dinucleotide binding domain-containing protein [Candidatus Bathyarchaeia archaeon]